MKIEAFVTLETVLRTGTLAAAAKALHLTPSAVSLQMKQLEAYIGQQLFDRSGLEIKPLPTAYEVSETMQRALDRLETFRRRKTVVVEGNLQLGIIESMQPLLLPGMTRILRARYPALHVQSRRGKSAELTTAVKAGLLDAAVASIREKLHKTPLVVQVPIGAEERFVGVVDLVGWRSLTWADDRLVVGPVPDELAERTTRARYELAETVAARHEAAFTEFVETGTVSADTLRAALRELTLSGEGLVVLAGAAYRNRGIEPLLDAVVAYLPSPVDIAPVRAEGEVTRAADPEAPFAALVFKVVPAASGRIAVARVYSGTVRPGDTVVASGGVGPARSGLAAGRESGFVRERIGRILHVQANRYHEVAEARAGEIVAFVGPKSARAGTTLSTPDDPVVLEAPTPTEPVVSVAVGGSLTGVTVIETVAVVVCWPSVTV